MTGSMEREFGSELVQCAIEWLQNSADPEDVFSEEDLADWATRKGWIGKDTKPEDAFTEDELGKWAETNGYAKEE